MEYDFKKAKELIKSEKKAVSASIGMLEDWYWTAENVWKEGEFTQNLDEITTIGGINGSHWATPTLRFYYEDDKEKNVTIAK